MLQECSVHGAPTENLLRQQQDLEVHSNVAAGCSALKTNEKELEKYENSEEKKSCNGQEDRLESGKCVNNLRFWRTSRWLNKGCRANALLVARRGSASQSRERRRSRPPAVRPSLPTSTLGLPETGQRKSHTPAGCIARCAARILNELLAGRQPWKISFSERDDKKSCGRCEKKKSAPQRKHGSSK